MTASVVMRSKAVWKTLQRQHTTNADPRAVCRTAIRHRYTSRSSLTRWFILIEQLGQCRERLFSIAEPVV